MSRAPAALLAFTVAASIGCVSMGNEKSLKIAQVAGSPRSFNGKFVRLHACSSTDVHRAWLSDCYDPNSPLIALPVSPSNLQPSTAALVDEHLGLEAAFGQPRTVSATFVGVFEWSQSTYGMVALFEPNAVLAIGGGKVARGTVEMREFYSNLLAGG